MTIRLGVNIDHVATVRNARGGAHPDPLRLAQEAQAGGADGITIHLREDRRHIRDDDVLLLRREMSLPLNLEMAATAWMQDFAIGVRPHACCLVPERRAEVTTEGGLDVRGQERALAPLVAALAAAGIRVSMFIDPDPDQVRAAHGVGARAVELHTGAYCLAPDRQRPVLLQRIGAMADLATALGLECHAGHGLNFQTAAEVATLPAIIELNIGHFLVGEALVVGLRQATAEMKRVMLAARRGGAHA